jgi:hypothetical protein
MYHDVDTTRFRVGVVPEVGLQDQPQARADLNRGGLFLDGNRWFLQNYANGEVNIAAEQHQNVYIYNCKNVLIVIPAKITHLQLENCEHVTVRFSSVIASVEVYRCRNIKLNCSKMVNTLQIDNTNGCKLYLPKNAARDVSIVHTCVDEMELYEIDQGHYTRYVIPSSGAATFRLRSGMARRSSEPTARQYVTRLSEQGLITQDVDALKGSQGYVVLPSR